MDIAAYFLAAYFILFAAHEFHETFETPHQSFPWHHFCLLMAHILALFAFLNMVRG